MKDGSREGRDRAAEGVPHCPWEDGLDLEVVHRLGTRKGFLARGEIFQPLNYSPKPIKMSVSIGVRAGTHLQRSEIVFVPLKGSLPFYINAVALYLDVGVI